MTLAPVELIHYDGVDYKIPVDAEYQAGEITRTLSKKIKDIQVLFLRRNWSNFLNSMVL